MKNTFITGAETVNAGTKFIIRDIAQQQVGARRETVRLVEIEARQRFPTGEKGCGHPFLVRRNTVKSGVKSFI